MDPELPHDVDGLIELLDKVFPEKSPNRDDKLSDVYHQGGQRSVVRWLLQLQERTR